MVSNGVEWCRMVTKCAIGTNKIPDAGRLPRESHAAGKIHLTCIGFGKGPGEEPISVLPPFPSPSLSLSPLGGYGGDPPSRTPDLSAEPVFTEWWSHTGSTKDRLP